jgi:ligand-binding sensor domain-containing protein
LKQGLLYVGTDDGKVWLTPNDGKEWADITQRLPSKWISRVEASHHELGTVYVSFTGYREDDFKTYLFASDDYGAHWRTIRGNLPDEPVNVIREDPKNGNVLYIGTDLGVFVTLDRGQTWHSLTNGLPTTPVYDLVIHPRDREIVIATHGRSMFIADVRPLQELTADVSSKTAHLFEIAPARLGKRWRGRGVWEQEPNDDAIIYYYLKDAENVEITIRDEQGTVVRQLEGTSDTGLNRIVWDLTQPKDDSSDKFVTPATYAIELIAGESRLEGSVVVTGHQN